MANHPKHIPEHPSLNKYLLLLNDPEKYRIIKEVLTKWSAKSQSDPFLGYHTKIQRFDQIIEHIGQCIKNILNDKNAMQIYSNENKCFNIRIWHKKGKMYSACAAYAYVYVTIDDMNGRGINNFIDTLFGNIYVDTEFTSFDSPGVRSKLLDEEICAAFIWIYYDIPKVDSLIKQTYKKIANEINKMNIYNDSDCNMAKRIIESIPVHIVDDYCFIELFNNNWQSKLFSCVIKEQCVLYNDETIVEYKKYDDKIYITNITEIFDKNKKIYYYAYDNNFKIVYSGSFIIDHI